MQQANESDKTRLTDEEWSRIFVRLSTTQCINTGMPLQCRCFVEAVLWVLRVGGQWRSLPPDRRNWNSIFKRFARRSALGVWRRLQGWMEADADLQDVSIDSTIARAHACAAGAANGGAEEEALGRSRGGLGCKIHTVCGCAGIAGQVYPDGRASCRYYPSHPVTGWSVSSSLPDKGYDSDALLAWLKERGVLAVIPPKANRKERRDCDWWRYKERHVVECMFGKLKCFRRIAMRYEKKAINFTGMLAFAATCCGCGSGGKMAAEPK